jgi:hypothetical protein
MPVVAQVRDWIIAVLAVKLEQFRLGMVEVARKTETATVE